MKLYPVKEYSPEEWDNYCDQQYDNGEHPEENEITIVWHDGKACLDIQATGKRIVPILRKVEKALTEAGLAGQDGVFAGWFGSWADSLTDSFDKRYFIWNYDGKQDMEAGRWSYSWGIEQLDDDLWYIFLNIATASSGVMEHIEQVIKENKQAEEDNQAIQAMESEDMENLHGDVARIWFKGEDAEASDDFPVLWEILPDGEIPEKRKLHRSTYSETTNRLSACGYIW